MIRRASAVHELGWRVAAAMTYTLAFDRRHAPDHVAPHRGRVPVTDHGRPLSAATRAEMEPRFGHDFSEVKVHADDEAAASASSVHAQAYAFGSHIVFGAA